MVKAESGVQGFVLGWTALALQIIGLVEKLPLSLELTTAGGGLGSVSRGSLCKCEPLVSISRRDYNI
jgi:hypothetical protein